MIALTNAQLERIAGGLAALDGLRLKPGEFEPFNFPAETTFKIANNSALFADRLEATGRAKKILAVKYQVGERMTITAENAQRVSEFMEAAALLDDKLVEVCGVEIISRAALNVGCDAKKNQNRIPPSVLAAIAPLLEP